MASPKLDAVELMRIAEEAEAFGALIVAARRASADAQWKQQWMSSPREIEGLKQSQTARQASPDLFLHSYGL